MAAGVGDQRRWGLELVAAARAGCMAEVAEDFQGRREADESPSCRFCPGGKPETIPPVFHWALGQWTWALSSEAALLSMLDPWYSPPAG